MIDVLAPVAGRVLPLRHVPDPVFAAAMVGPGLAVEPLADGVLVRAPVSGLVRLAKPHAFIVEASGRSVLVHLGVDTVTLKGAGFDLLVAQGSSVAVGDAVVRWDPAGVAARGFSAVVVVVALAKGAALDLVAAEGVVVAPGDTLFRWH